MSEISASNIPEHLSKYPYDAISIIICWGIPINDREDSAVEHPSTSRLSTWAPTWSARRHAAISVWYRCSPRHWHMRPWVIELHDKNVFFVWRLSNVRAPAALKRNMRWSDCPCLIHTQISLLMQTDYAATGRLSIGQVPCWCLHNSCCLPHAPKCIATR